MGTGGGPSASSPLAAASHLAAPGRGDSDHTLAGSPLAPPPRACVLGVPTSPLPAPRSPNSPAFLPQTAHAGPISGPLHLSSQALNSVQTCQVGTSPRCLRRLIFIPFIKIAELLVISQYADRLPTLSNSLLVFSLECVCVCVWLYGCVGVWVCGCCPNKINKHNQEEKEQDRT